MSILKSLSSNPEFISNPIEQGSAESDWVSYTATVDCKGEVVPVLDGSTKKVIVTSTSMEVTDTLSCQVGTDTAVVPITPDSVISIGAPGDISGAKYLTHYSYNITGAFFLTPDGLALYYVNTSNTLSRTTLSTAWDISEISAGTVVCTLTNQESLTSGLHFKPDGLKMFTVGSAQNRVFMYSLSAAWGGTITYSGTSFSLSSQSFSARTLRFNTEGTKMYVLSSANSVYQYTLSTAWDITTATYDNKSFNSGTPVDIWFNSDGSTMFTATQYSLKQFTLSTPYDISTASDTGLSTSLSDSTSNLFINNDFTYLYLRRTGVGTARYSLYDHSDIRSVRFKKDYNSAWYTGISGTVACLSKDGTKAFVNVSSTNYVHKYYLSIPGDLSTAYASGQSVYINTNTVRVCAISDDGLHFYQTYDAVIYYCRMTVPYDLSTLTLITTSTLNLGVWPINGLYIKPDGTRLFLSFASTTVYEFKLSTPFALSTINALNVAFKTVTLGYTIYGIQFSSDGTYMIGSGSGGFYRFNLSTAWDITTATYNSSSPSASSPYPFTLSYDGTSIYYNILKYRIRLFEVVVDISSEGLTETPTRTQKLSNTVLATSMESLKSRCISTQIETGLISATTDQTVFKVPSTTAGFANFDTNTIKQGDPLLCTIDGIETGITAVSSTMLDYESPNIGNSNLTFVLQRDMSPSGVSGGYLFSPDGTKFYACNGTLYYSVMSTPWLLSSLVYTNSYATNLSTYSFAFSSDGLKLYYVTNNSGIVYQKALSTPWLPVASYDSGISLSSTIGTGSCSIVFDSTGTRMYISSTTYSKIFQFTLSTAWNVGTAVYSEKYLSIGGFSVVLRFNTDGSCLFYSIGTIVYQVLLTTPYDISTAVLLGSYTSQNGTLQDMFFKPDGTKIYFVSGSYFREWNISANVLVPYEKYKQYTVDIDTQIEAPTVVKIPSRAVVDSEVSKAWAGGDVLSVGFSKKTKPNGRAIQYKLSAAEGTEISKIKYDLERV